MNRLLVPRERIGEGEARVEGESLHYLARVLRLGPGDAVEVFDGEGSVWDGEVAAVTPEQATIRLGARRSQPAVARITLAQGLAKGDKLDLVVQKATELGASRIAPLRLERCVVHLDASKGADRARRWRKIAEEAARQCGRADVPEVDEPASLDAFLDTAAGRGERIAVLWEGQDPGVRLGPWLLAEPDRPVALVVGPEGGLSAAEIERIRERGGAVLSLGRRVLRTETVGLAVLSIALHLAGDLG